MRIKQTTKQNTHNSLTYYTISKEQENNLFIEYIYSKFIVQIIDIVNQFNAGNVEYVRQRFTDQIYNILLSILNTKKYDINPFIKNVRQFFISLLNVFKRIIEDYIRCKDIENQLDNTKQRASILDDPEQLEQYILSLSKRMTLFQDKMVTVPMATLKPQYAEYINLYGFPKNANFDPILLQGITTRLLDQGILKNQDVYS